jgi:hypothetical protein
LQAAEKDPYVSLRSIASHQRTADVRLQPVLSAVEGSIFRAPRLWISLSSLQGAFFSSLPLGSLLSKFFSGGKQF